MFDPSSFDATEFDDQSFDGLTGVPTAPVGVWAERAPVTDTWVEQPVES